MDEFLPLVTGDAFILEGRTRRFEPKQWLFLGVALVSLCLLGLVLVWISGLTTPLPLPKNTVVLTLGGRSSTLPPELTSPVSSFFFPRVAGLMQDENEQLRAFAYIPRWKKPPTGYVTISRHRLWQLITTHEFTLSETTVTPSSLPLIKATWLSEGMVRIILPTPQAGASSITFFKKGPLWKSDLPFAQGEDSVSLHNGTSFFLTNHPDLQALLLPLFGVPSIKERLRYVHRTWSGDALELVFQTDVSTSTLATLLPLANRSTLEARELADGTTARILRSPTHVPDLPYTATSTDGRSVYITTRSFSLGQTSGTQMITHSCSAFTVVASFSPIPSTFPFLHGQALFIGSSDGMLALCLNTDAVDN